MFHRSLRHCLSIAAIALTAILSPLSAEDQAVDLSPIKKTEAEWRKLLTPQQFNVTRRSATEKAFSGAYWREKRSGTYSCVCCQLPLFSSETKFESGSGWPSFYQPLDSVAVDLVRDTSYGMIREEVVCSRCGGHLGHVIDDGPAPTGLRYCMNSAAMVFEKTDKRK